jgi:pyruvate carboxylase subunit B
MTTNGTYRALVGERSFDIQVSEDGQLTVNDATVQVGFERVGEDSFLLLVDGQSLPVVIEQTDGDTLRVTLNGRVTTVQVKDERAMLLERFGLADAAGAHEQEIRAPMPGLVLNVMVEEGQEVQEGDGLIVLEAMKMENELRAQADGVVAKVQVAAGDAVGKNDLLLELE